MFNNTKFITMKQRNLLFFALALLMLTGLSSCGNKNSAGPGRVKIDVPCTGGQYAPNDESFRAYGFGESPDREIAMKIAQTNAAQKMAQQMKMVVRATSENYNNQYATESGTKVEKRFNDLTRVSVSETLEGAVPICQELYQNSKTGGYEYHILLELKSSALLSKIKERAMKDEQLRTDFDYENFKKTFEEEMDKMSKENQ